MMGSYLNPHAIQPGEILTPQLLFERYLDWHNYKEYVVKAWSKGETCDEELWKGRLCCEDHFRYQHEADDFFRYFCHLDMMIYADRGFNNDLIKGFIRRLKLKYDPARLAKCMGKTLEECFAFMMKD